MVRITAVIRRVPNVERKPSLMAGSRKKTLALEGPTPGSSSATVAFDEGGDAPYGKPE